MNNVELLALLQDAKRGDKRASTILFEFLSVRLRAIVKHKVWWWSASEQGEVVQATLASLAEKIQEIGENPAGYALRILHYKIGNELKAKSSRTSILYDANGDGPELMTAYSNTSNWDRMISSDSPDHGVEGREELERVARSIESLKPFCRALFKGMLEGLSINEVWARVVEIEPALTRSAFDKRVFDCRKELRKFMRVEL